MDKLILFHLEVIKAHNNLISLNEQGALLEVNCSVLDKIYLAALLLNDAKEELLAIENS